jgi:hypothetical protein
LEFTDLCNSLTFYLSLALIALKYANQNGFVSEEALANEKAGRALLDAGKGPRAASYFSKARDCYKLWNAVTKGEEMDNLVARLAIMQKDTD